jgi:hypothetical protein
LSDLGRYPYTGHSFILGKRKKPWQDINYVLHYFDRKPVSTRKQYRVYVQKGIKEGRRLDLVGGGLIRSMGGWAEVKSLRKGKGRLKGDERILGDSAFVLEVLNGSKEQLDRTYQLKAEGYDLEKLALRVARLFELEPQQLYSPGKYPEIVKARSVFCYWAVRELGRSATSIAKELRLSQPAVSISVKRGERIAREMGLKMLEK